MEKGDKCICQSDHWFNAFGDISEELSKGMRLTVLENKKFCGQTYYKFKETDQKNFFWSHGFVPLRNLN